MDTSKEYIKMCEKAEEIQELPARRYNGSLVFHPEHGMRVMYWSKHHGSPPPYYFSKPAIWLPRQDQLQKIWQDEFNNVPLTGMIDEFYDWVRNLSPYNNPDYLEWSMEQCWLAFVMKEKYQKHWNGKDWVCINK